MVDERGGCGNHRAGQRWAEMDSRKAATVAAGAGLVFLIAKREFRNEGRRSGAVQVDSSSSRLRGDGVRMGEW